MDGDLVIDSHTSMNYDFVDPDHADLPSDNILDPFNEESARQHFADAGYHNVQFVYPSYPYQGE